mmetsp:Transcript_43637/g.100660  ORF Transcript_43637/g.100660 Transcript_43637/m.100660 type:complete len:1118 (-) Transcript_43637:116-3469(-)
MAGRPGKGDVGGLRIKTHAFKVLAPEALVGSILGGGKGGGKGGGRTEKEKIQAEIGVKLTLSNRDEHYPDTRLRLIIIHGEESAQVLAGINRLIDKVVECGQDRIGPRGDPGDFVGEAPGEIVFRVALPSVIDDRVIGPNGDGLVQIAEDTGARVSADHEFYDGHFMVQIYGVPDVVRRCNERLLSFVDDVCRQEPFAVWAAVRSFPPGGGSAAPPAPAPRHQSTSRSELPDHKDSRRGGSAVGSTAGSRNSDTRFGDRPMPSSRHSRSAEVSHVSRDLPASNSTVLAIGANQSRHSNNHSRHDKLPADSAKRAQAPPSHPMLEALHAIAEFYPDGGLEVDYLITCELPARCCGALIGRKGEYLSYVERVTGAKVKFEEVDKTRRPSEESTRKMTVTGRLLGVYAAHALMMKRFLDSENPDGRSRQEDDPLRPRLEAVLAGGSGGREDGRHRRSGVDSSDGRHGDHDRSRRGSSRQRDGGSRRSEPSLPPRRSRSRRQDSHRGTVPDPRRAGSERRSDVPLPSQSKRPTPTPSGYSRGSDNLRDGGSSRPLASELRRSRSRKDDRHPRRSGVESGRVEHRPARGGAEPSADHLPHHGDQSSSLRAVSSTSQLARLEQQTRFAPAAPVQQWPQMRAEDATSSGFLKYLFGATATISVQEDSGLKTMGHHMPPSISTWDEAVAKGMLAAPVRSGLQAHGMSQPTPVQSRMLPLIAADKLVDVIVEAPAGSGKSFGYLLPLVSKLAGRVPGVRGILPSGSALAPSLMILVPGREVVEQLGSVARDMAMSAHPELKVLTVTCLADVEMYMAAERKPADILFATADGVMDALNGGRLSLAQVSTVVLDDADQLLEMPHVQMMEKVLSYSDLPQSNKQMILVSRFFFEELAPAATLLLRALPDVVAFQAALDATASAGGGSHGCPGPGYAACATQNPTSVAAAAASMPLVEHRVGWISNLDELWQGIGPDVVALLQECVPGFERIAIFANTVELARAAAVFLRQPPTMLRCLEWPSAMGSEAQHAAAQDLFSNPIDVVVVAHGNGMPFDLLALQSAGLGAILQMDLPLQIEAYLTRAACLSSGGVALSYATERDDALFPALRQAMYDAGSCAPSWMADGADSW